MDLESGALLTGTFDRPGFSASTVPQPQVAHKVGHGTTHTFPPACQGNVIRQQNRSKDRTLFTASDTITNFASRLLPRALKSNAILEIAPMPGEHTVANPRGKAGIGRGLIHTEELH